MLKNLIKILLFSSLLICLCGCDSSITSSDESIDIQILATSDLHGKFYPWNYALNSEDYSGSLLQAATAVKEKRNDNTLLLDAGDVIQDNMADLFLDEDIHPMIAAMNYMGYDACTVGNHEFNYGMDVLAKVLNTQKADVLVGNVWDAQGKPLGKPYKIYKINGVKIGVIGMVTPNILRWDSVNLEGCTVADPAIETSKIIEEIEDKTDILIALVHMDVENEYGLENSGAADLANACPGLNLIIASHGHNAIDSLVVNGVPIVENKSMAETIGEIHFTVGKNKKGYDILDTRISLINVADYDADTALAEILAPYDKRAKDYSEVVIGKIQGKNITPKNEIEGIYDIQLIDTPVVDFINTVQMYYSGAKVASTSFANVSAQIDAGDIRRCDVSQMYKYSNTLYTLEMTGSQLKKYMEKSAEYFNQFNEGDLTISFNENVRTYNYDYFSGVKFEIDISKPIGNRIVNLRWMDDTPVKDEESFLIAVNDYRAKTFLLTPGEIYEEDDIPTLVDMDIRGDIGGIRELIADYICNVCGGEATLTADNNWKLVGFSWDDELRAEAIREINDGTITLTDAPDGRTTNVVSITANDLKNVQ